MGLVPGLSLSYPHCLAHQNGPLHDNNLIADVLTFVLHFGSAVSRRSDWLFDIPCRLARLLCPPPPRGGVAGVHLPQRFLLFAESLIFDAAVSLVPGSRAENMT